MTKTLTAALALALAGGLATGGVAEAQTVKVGVILTYSGPATSLGEQIDKGVRLYVKEHEKDLPPGVKVEIIRRDDTGPSPDVAKRLAQELITRDKVQYLAGVVWTPNASAIAPLATESKTPFVVMNAAGAALTTLSPYLIRTSFTLWQTSYPLGQWAAKQGIKKAYTAVTDYAPGHDGEQAFIKGFTEAGGEIVGSVRMPIQSADFVPFMQRIKDANPGALFVFVPSGKAATAVMKAYGDLGLGAAGIKLIGPADITPDAELPLMGDIALGITTAGNYSAGATRPQNKAYLAAWRKEYGNDNIPDYMSVAGWDGMAAIYSTIIAQKGKIDPEKTMELLKTFKNPDSPRGTIEIDPATRDIVQNIYIRRVEKVDGAPVNVEFDTIPMLKDPWKALNPK